VPRPAAVLLTAAAIALAGCGSSSSSSSSSNSGAAAAAPAATPKGALALAADPSGQLKYDTTSLTAPRAGKVSIDLTNNAPLPHNVTVTTAGGKLLGATPTFSGGSKTLTLTLKPGTYTFFCSVPGHRMAGMQGTLVVK
jgi:plastocyanin